MTGKHSPIAAQPGPSAKAEGHSNKALLLPNMTQRLLVVLILGFSSGLPLALITSTLQAWFADSGMSILATGFLSLLGLPYALRFLWGPLLDHYSPFNLGKRRGWILTTQVALLIGFNLMAWFSPQTHPMWMGALALALAFCSATQDAAIDAHRTEYLPIPEHGLGATLAIFGYRIALLVSGGLALILAQHVGWVITYRLMGCLLILGMVTTWFCSEPSQPTPPFISFSSSFTAPVKALLTLPKFGALLCFILLYKLGEAFTSTSSGIVMPFLIQGLGFSLETIGYVNKIVGVIAILLGGLTAGILLMRWPLYRALMVFGLLQAIANCSFVLLAMAGKNLMWLNIAIISDNFAAGLGSTALVVLLMRVVDRRFTATQFSILAALATLPRNFSGPIAASLQASLGWVGLYQLSVLLALGFIPFLYQIKSIIPEGRLPPTAR